MQFSDPDIQQTLDGYDATALDQLTFGVVRMDKAGVVVDYNRFEADRARLSQQAVIGRDFYVEVAACAHNYLVAQRLFDADELDAMVDYVFTWKTKRAPVRLRLLKQARSSYMYMLVEPRA